MRPASYLSRLIRGANEQPVLLPQRMLFRPTEPTAEHGFTEIDTAASILAGDLSANSANARWGGRANGLEARQVVNPGLLNAFPAPRGAREEVDTRLTPATSLHVHRGFSQVSATSLNAGPDVNRVSTERVAAGPDIAPVQKSASSNTARQNLSGKVVPPGERRGSFNEVVTGSVGGVVGPQPLESDGPVGRPTPVSNSQKAAAAMLWEPKSAAAHPTPAIATDRERREAIGQSTAELKTKFGPTTIDPKPVSEASRPVLSPSQVFGTGRSDSQPGRNPSSAAPVALVPPPPSERFASANGPENRREAAVGDGPAVRIGTLEVRINPPPPVAIPQSPIARSLQAPRPVVSLARGFGSFGLVQG